MYEQIFLVNQKAIRKEIFRRSKSRWLAMTVMDIITTPLQLVELIVVLPVVWFRSKKKDRDPGIECIRYASNLVSTKLLSKIAGWY